MTKRVGAMVAVLAISICLAGLPLFAQRGGGGGHGMGGGMGMGERPSGSFGHEGTNSQPRMGGDQNGAMAGSRNPMGESKLGKNSPTDLLSQNTHLASNLQSLLPAGTNLQDAASGFKNLGLFVAAVHVSHNLGIPFDQLKSTMLSNGDNLGKAIHTLNPNISKKEVKSDVKKANRQAKRDIKKANS
jgi:hypothetical protein